LNLGTQAQVIEPEMTLLVSMRNSHSRFMSRYVPTVLSDELRRWLFQAVGKSELPEVGFIWRGSLVRNHHARRSIQVYVKVADGNLDYQQGWPALTGLNARLVVDNGKLDVSVDKGQM